jgi:macrolide-specific efflux system membrane fusion protein
VQYGTAVGLTAAPTGLRPGMSASVSIVVAQAGDTTFVPSVALTTSGGVGATTATAQVLGTDGQTSQRAVGVGLTSDTTTQVTSGLAPGELVVLPDPTGASEFGGPPNNAQQTGTAGR